MASFQHDSSNLREPVVQGSNPCGLTQNLVMRNMAKRIRIPIEQILKGNPSYHLYINEFEGELQHEEDSARLAFNTALFMGWTRREANELFCSALIHDIGKFASDGRVLFSPIKSSKQAKRAREMHIDKGRELCDKFNVQGLPREIVCDHHEVFEGRGYPGLKRGYEISPEVRLTSIVESYIALTTPRSYRQAYSPLVARKIMLYQDSWKYEPNLLREFFVFLKEEGYFEKKVTLQAVDFSASMIG